MCLTKENIMFFVNCYLFYIYISFVLTSFKEVGSWLWATESSRSEAPKATKQPGAWKRTFRSFGSFTPLSGSIDAPVSFSEHRGLGGLGRCRCQTGRVFGGWKSHLRSGYKRKAFKGCSVYTKFLTHSPGCLPIVWCACIDIMNLLCLNHWIWNILHPQITTSVPETHTQKAPDFTFSDLLWIPNPENNTIIITC